MRKVFVLGIGQTVFGKQPQYSAAQLGAMAAEAAIRDAGIDRRSLTVAYGSRAMDPLQIIEDVMKRVGVAGIEMHNVENACASGGSAVNLLWKDIAYGLCDCGIAVGCESMSAARKGGGLLQVGSEDINTLLGISMPALGALNAQRLMHTWGATPADIAYPSVKNHRNACLNPYAQYKKPVTVEDVLHAHLISDPLTTLHCCPNSDGAAAVILCSEAFARRYTTCLVEMASSVVLSAPFEDTAWDISDVRMIEVLSQAAYRPVGIEGTDLDLVELHDAFAPEELYAYEATGVCAAGEGLKFLREGGAEIGGRCAFSPSGGLQAQGHPLGASGVRVVCEITAHLRGTAGERQVPHAKIGMAQMIGGYLSGLGSPSVGAAHILKR